MGTWFTISVIALALFPPSLFVSIPLWILYFIFQQKQINDTNTWNARVRTPEELKLEQDQRERFQAELAKRRIANADPFGKKSLKPEARHATPPHAVRAEAHDSWLTSWRDKCESPAEVAFLNAAISEFNLRPDGSRLKGQITLELQHRVGGARADFLVGDKLIVEVDGHAYHSSGRQAKRDARRDAALRVKDYRILRITAHRVFSAPDAAMADVRDALR